MNLPSGQSFTVNVPSSSARVNDDETERRAFNVTVGLGGIWGSGTEMEVMRQSLAGVSLCQRPDDGSAPL